MRYNSQKQAVRSKTLYQLHKLLTMDYILLVRG